MKPKYIIYENKAERDAFIKRTNGICDTFSYLYDIDALEKVTEE